ncbi:uncharacterized protein LOC126899916 [Daktulosphaira vitifoliae]|uniref:uncharacterized protein LOC126899916 n=1 Tax=Daktulosphaira vitifoliae TaxID=58002 RepID=UPI0021AA9689|nr:uncharacterized protein LOC126899916 [Daktulosphaira vitifoliae]
MIAMVYCLASRDFAVNMSLINVGLEIFNVFFTFYFLHYEYWKRGVKVNGTNVSGGNFTDLFLIYLIFEVIYFILIDGFRYMPDRFNEVVDRTATKNLYLCLYDFHLEYFDHFIHIIMFIMYIWMWFALNIKLKHG